MLTIQMAPQESEVKVMTGGYSSAHWDQIICQELLSFQPATLDNPVSLHVDNRMNNRCHYVFAFLHSNSLYCVLCDLQIPQFMFFLPLVYLK